MHISKCQSHIKVDHLLQRQIRSMLLEYEDCVVLGLVLEELRLSYLNISRIPTLRFSIIPIIP
jgi:hypothetical protein